MAVDSSKPKPVRSHIIFPLIAPRLPASLKPALAGAEAKPATPDSFETSGRRSPGKRGTPKPGSAD